MKSSPVGGDATALLDNITILPIASGTAPFVTPDGNPTAVLTSVGGSASFYGRAVGYPTLTYQWLVNGSPISGANQPTLTLNNVQKSDDADYSLVISNSFGSATTTVAHLTVYEAFRGLFNTGVDDNGLILADSTTDPHYQLIVNPDTGTTGALVEDSVSYPITGTWLVDSPTSKWIGPQLNTSNSAAGTFTYRTLINLTGRDPSKLIIVGQWASDNYGLDIQVNGNSTANAYSSSFAAYTTFTIYGTNTGLNWVAGTNTLDFVVKNDALGYTGLRVEFTLSNLPIPPGTAPIIATQPVGRTAIVGDTVTLTAAAWGSATLKYQWQKGGVAIAGQTGLTLTLANVTAADSGSYSVLVTNSAGSAASSPAMLTVLPTPTFAYLTNGLVLHLRFDGNYADSSGHGNDASAPAGDVPFVTGDGPRGLHRHHARQLLPGGHQQLRRPPV